MADCHTLNPFIFQPIFSLTIHFARDYWRQLASETELPLKLIIMKSRIFLLVTLIVALGVVSTRADKTPATLPVALKGVTLAEIPAKAASLIAAAPLATRESTATEIITGAVKTYPAIASAIVGTVCTKCPEVAAAVTKAAIAVQPKQAEVIAKAAAAAAPKHTAEITAALLALSKTTPSLQPSLAPVISSLQGGTAVQVASATVTDPTTTTPPTGSRLRGPVVSGPYVPLSGTPTNSPPGTPVPPTGDYARP